MYRVAPRTARAAIRATVGQTVTYITWGTRAHDADTHPEPAIDRASESGRTRAAERGRGARVGGGRRAGQSPGAARHGPRRVGHVRPTPGRRAGGGPAREGDGPHRARHGRDRPAAEGQEVRRPGVVTAPGLPAARPVVRG